MYNLPLVIPSCPPLELILKFLQVLMQLDKGTHWKWLKKQGWTMTNAPITKRLLCWSPPLTLFWKHLNQFIIRFIQLDIQKRVFHYLKKVTTTNIKSQQNNQRLQDGQWLIRHLNFRWWRHLHHLFSFYVWISAKCWWRVYFWNIPS